MGGGPHDGVPNVASYVGDPIPTDQHPCYLGHCSSRICDRLRLMLRLKFRMIRCSVKLMGFVVLNREILYQIRLGIISVSGV